MVTSSNPITLQAAVGMACRLTNDVVRSSEESKGNDSGRKRYEDQQRNRGRNQQDKRKRVTKNYEVTVQEPRPYVGPHPKCARCNLHHSGNWPKCDKCKQMGHLARNFHRAACYECGSFDHLRNVCPREILLDCKLNLTDKLFDIDLIPIELKSFDVVIGMDWLTKVQAKINCLEKVLKIPLEGGKTLIVQGEKPERDLKIVSAIKMRKYFEKECFTFLAHVVEKIRRSGTCSKGAISFSTIRDARIVREITGTFEQGFDQAKFIPLGSSNSLRQEEGQINAVPSIESSRERHSQDSVQDALRALRISCHAITPRVLGHYSEDSMVTYTAVSSPFKDGSDIGSPGVDGPPIMPENPYAYIMAAYQVPSSLDYIPGPEVPPSPDYIPGPEEDEILPAEEQPLPATASPNVDSPGYVLESDPEEEPEEDDEDPEEDPANYPADRDDDDDDDEDEDEDEEEESTQLRPTLEEVERLLALTTPLPSPLTPLSSPLPRIPSPSFPASPPVSPIRPLGYHAAMIRLRAETPSTYHPLPLPISSPPLQLLSSNHRTDRLEITLPPRKRLGIDLGPRYEIGESSAAVATRPIGGCRADYVFVDPRVAVEEVTPMTLEGVNVRVTEHTAVQEQDTQDIYAYHYETVRLLDQEALVSREAWGRSVEAADRKSQVVTLEMLQADYQRQVQLAEALKLLKGLQTQMVEFQSLLSIMGYSQLADCIDLLFCLATQYRSFVQKMAPKRKTTRLNPDATPTPVTDTHTTTSVTNAQIQAMINEGVTAALAARDATRNGDDSHTSGTGARRPVQVARECTYPDFLKCQPLNFKGTEGVVGLTQWFEKMESVYSISNCTVACQVKFATCTLQGNALTWWNSHVKTTTPEAAHAMPWRTLKKMMTDKYCPRGEIKKLEFEMWNLKVKGNDVVTYSQRFQELALMCDRMFPEEIDQVEKYVGGLPDTIHGSVMATKPKTMQDAIEFATELMDKKINTWAERQADNKRKSDDTTCLVCSKLFIRQFAFWFPDLLPFIQENFNSGGSIHRIQDINNTHFVICRV
ncbi:putative reverse transcriptase domain-containing protein [Tanacetum coccineum]